MHTASLIFYEMNILKAEAAKVGKIRAHAFMAVSLKTQRLQHGRRRATLAVTFLCNEGRFSSAPLRRPDGQSHVRVHHSSDGEW